MNFKLMLMKTSNDRGNGLLLCHRQLAFCRSKCTTKHLDLVIFIQPLMFVEHLPHTRHCSKFLGFITIDTETSALMEFTL